MMISSSSVIGISLSKCCKKRVYTLKDFISIFQVIKSDIVFKRCSIDEIINNLKDNSNGEIIKFFSKSLNIGDGINENNHLANIKILKSLELNDDEIYEINNAVSSIGGYDSTTQCEILDKAINRLEHCLCNAKKDMDKNSKLYSAVGITLGLVVSLVLL